MSGGGGSSRGAERLKALDPVVDRRAGGQSGRWERPGGDADLSEVRQVWRGEVVEALNAWRSLMRHNILACALIKDASLVGVCDGLHSERRLTESPDQPVVHASFNGVPRGVRGEDGHPGLHGPDNQPLLPIFLNQTLHRPKQRRVIRDDEVTARGHRLVHDGVREVVGQQDGLHGPRFAGLDQEADVIPRLGQRQGGELLQHLQDLLELHRPRTASRKREAAGGREAKRCVQGDRSALAREEAVAVRRGEKRSRAV